MPTTLNRETSDLVDAERGAIARRASLTPLYLNTATTVALNDHTYSRSTSIDPSRPGHPDRLEGA